MNEQVSTIADFFQQAFGLDWTEMRKNEWIDVSGFGRSIESYNEQTEQKEFRKVLGVVRKDNAPGYKVTVGDRWFYCSGDHRVYCPSSKGYPEVQNLVSGAQNGMQYPVLLDNLEEGVIKIEPPRGEIPILDLQVEGNKNYFSNGILSHNTMYGNPETTTGGNALKYYASIRMDVRKIENIVLKEEVIGVKARVKNVKNKTAPPFRKGEIEVFFGGERNGIDSFGEYVAFAASLGVLEKAGSWYSYGTRMKEQGLENVRKALSADPALFTEIKEKVIALMNPVKSDAGAEEAKPKRTVSKKGKPAEEEGFEVAES